MLRGACLKRVAVLIAVMIWRVTHSSAKLRNEVFGVPAGEEIRARLEADEAVVAPDQDVERPAVTVPGAQHELKVFELPLGFLRSGCGPCGHPGLPRVSGARRKVSP